ncbi:DUF4153 domain-containing protein [Prevotella herbatica]|uniref:DUF4153 domain-containing protein n=1 Tax=Prevotella herbatica TaxID=2801997 RepID=A0ABN6EJW8_9BACT|nr:DUF4153 domain-containing protein [Prevotella herbatica]BCS86182.1 DUF4153 domain-containing protein [Prevotella herbatica]
MEKLTLEKLKDNFILSCKRFPISIFFLLWFTVTLIYFGLGKSRDAQFFNVFYSGSAALLTCVLRLWEEEVDDLKRCRIIQGAIHVCWLAAAVYISFYCDMNLTVEFSVFALSFTIAIAFFIVPFFKENDDISLWNFTYHTFLTFVLSFIVALILMGGVMLLLESFTQLFGVVLCSDAYYDVAVVCNGFIAPFLFLQLIPKHDKMHKDSVKRLPKFMYGIIHYLFIPLTIAYLITLYAYAAKIIFQWELPEGWVSWLVTALMTLMTIIIVAVYPSQFSDGHDVDKKIVKWLPMCVLPLLLLMSIGILRRISDYGITANRLYISLFNLWCYGVCVWLIVSKARRIVWIPISFTVLLLLSSVGPQNFSSLAFSSLKSDVIKGLKMAKVAKLPMDITTYKKWIKQKDASMNDIISNIYYLKSQYGNKVLTDIADSVTLMRINYFSADKSISDIEINNICDDNALIIPSGYKHVIPSYNYLYNRVKVDGDKISFIVEYEINGKKLKLPIDVSIKKMKSIENSKYIVPVKCSNAVLYFSSFSFSEDTKMLSFCATIFY